MWHFSKIQFSFTVEDFRMADKSEKRFRLQPLQGVNCKHYGRAYFQPRLPKLRISTECSKLNEQVRSNCHCEKRLCYAENKKCDHGTTQWLQSLSLHMNSGKPYDWKNFDKLCVTHEQ
jgi:hypothetical protein